MAPAGELVLLVRLAAMRSEQKSSFVPDSSQTVCNKVEVGLFGVQVNLGCEAQPSRNSFIYGVVHVPCWQQRVTMQVKTTCRRNSTLFFSVPPISAVAPRFLLEDEPEEGAGLPKVERFLRRCANERARLREGGGASGHNESQGYTIWFLKLGMGLLAEFAQEGPRPDSCKVMCCAALGRSLHNNAGSATH